MSFNMNQVLETNFAARTEAVWPPRNIRITPHFRRKRFAQFRKILDEVCNAQGVARIIDIGGVSDYWEELRDLWSDLPLEITLANLQSEKSQVQAPYSYCHLSATDLSPFADNSFDIVHSNSVIEHLGRWPAMVQMVGEVRRLAPRFYVQTPNFSFPYEPHYRSLFMHWYPEQVRASMILKKRRGFIGADTYDQAMLEVQEINLLSMRQMKALFPDAAIHREKFGFFTKSLIAIK
jgi:hypothetical protein